MTPFCTITPTRGDRHELLEFCKHQLSRMTLKPDKSYFIDHPPANSKVDLVERVRIGVNEAKADGFQYAFIVEDDDFYPSDYFERFDIGTFVFYGDQSSTYYHLKHRTYTTFKHSGRSSLFTTGFKISELDKFDWDAQNKFLDIGLWNYAYSQVQGIRQYAHSGAIGIKHGLGLCAGKGHVMKGENDDAYLKWLKENVDSEAFQFYTDLMKKL